MCPQLYIWLTVNFPDLCVSVYTRTTYRGVAPAPTPLMCGNMRIMPAVTAQKGCAGEACRQDLHRRCMDINALASCEQLLCHQLPCCSFDEPSFLWKRYVWSRRSISPINRPIIGHFGLVCVTSSAHELRNNLLFLQSRRERRGQRIT